MAGATPQREDRYFLVHASEDGIHMRMLTRRSLAEMLAAGELDMIQLKTIRGNELIDLQYAAGWYLIKGQQIIPQPVEKVVTWEFD